MSQRIRTDKVQLDILQAASSQIEVKSDLWMTNSSSLLTSQILADAIIPWSTGTLNIGDDVNHEVNCSGTVISPTAKHSVVLPIATELILGHTGDTITVNADTLATNNLSAVGSTIAVANDLTLASGKKLTTPAVCTDNIYEKTAANDIEMHNNVKMDGILKTDYIQKNLGSYIQLNSSMVQSSGFISTPNATCDNLNENTLGQGVLSTANFKIAAGKGLYSDSISSKSGGAITFNNTLDAAIITPSGGTLTIGSHETLSSGKTLTADTVSTDTINERTGSAGITLGHAVKMNSVAAGTSDKLMVWDSSTKSVCYSTPNQVKGYGIEWLEDFSSTAPAAYDETTNVQHIIADKPWYVKSNNILALKLGLDNDSAYQQGGDYSNGICFPHFLGDTDSALYYGFNNYMSFFRERGDIIYEVRARIPFNMSSLYYDGMKIFFGLSSKEYDGNLLTSMTRWCGLFFDSGISSTNWQFTVNSDGSGLTPFSATQALLTDVFTFKMTVKTSSVDFTLNNGSGSSTYTATGLTFPSGYGFMPRIGFFCDAYPTNSAGVRLGLTCDYIRVHQDYNRFS